MQILQYEKGMVYYSEPMTEDDCVGNGRYGHCPNCGKRHSWDEELDHKVVLPHSCDEWVIGGKEDVLQLIADLTALLPTLNRDAA